MDSIEAFSVFHYHLEHLTTTNKTIVVLCYYLKATVP